jgi:UDP-glucuronate 4-epimerase
MRALVTGAAGFIGSSLVDRLINDGHEVVGLDSFTPYYNRSRKESNIERARESNLFTFHEIDLSASPLEEVMDGVTDVFHQAGQPGVRASWGAEFQEYVRWNIWATQRLLEVSKKSPTLKSFVAASSSSVYGDAKNYPTSEATLPRPISPYGVTKLAAEHLCSLYGKEFGLPTVSLRYFTVYGPRQRPDMAISRIIAAALDQSEFVVFGDGNQERDFSYVNDIVEANIEASMRISEGMKSGLALNAGGNGTVSLLNVIQIVEELVGRSVRVQFKFSEAGDPSITKADISQIQSQLGWSPTTSIRRGVEAQIEWTRSRISERKN